MSVELEARPRSRGGRVLAGLLCGAGIVVLDFFIVLACLPTLELDLHATKAQLQLILAVYAVANGSFLVIGGRLGDAFGRRRVLLWGLGAFANASLACGLSTSATMLITLRVVQGMAGALVQPQVLGLLTVNFEPAERPRVMGLYAAAMGLSGIGAQLLGAFFVASLPVEYGWRLCFFVSVPLCLGSMYLMSSACEGPRAKSTSVDAIGAILLACSLGCLCTFLTVGREQGWPAWTFVVLAVGLLSAAALAVWLETGYALNKERIVPRGILSENSFWASLARIFLFYCGVASLYFVLALELRINGGYSPWEVGLYFAWLAVCFVSASMSGTFKAIIGPNWAMFGACALILGHALMLVAFATLTSLAQLAVLVVSCSLQGCGVGCMIGPLTGEALGKVLPERASVGGGLASATQQVGNSFGVAAIGFFYFTDVHPAGNILGATCYLMAMCVVLAIATRQRPSVVPSNA